MQELLINSTNVIGCLILLVTNIWILFGAFKTSRAVGWLFFLVPPMGALAWSLLEWQKAKTPVMANLVAGLALLGTGFIY